nr:TCR V beta 2/J beta 2.3 product=T-cell receptor beta chain variable region {CDR3 region, sample 2} [mice, SJL/J, kidney, Peptide Partial, 21 aa] [Mus sp.]
CTCSADLGGAETLYFGSGTRL